MTLILIFFLLCSLLVAFSSLPLPLLHPIFYWVLLFLCLLCLVCFWFLSVGPLSSPFSCSPPPAAVAPQAVEAGRAGRHFLSIHASACHPHRPVSFLQWDRLGVECTVWLGFTDHVGKKTDAQDDVIPQICPNVVWQVLCFHSLYIISDFFANWRHLRLTSLSAFSDLMVHLLIGPLWLCVLHYLENQTTSPLSAGLGHSSTEWSQVRKNTLGLHCRKLPARAGCVCSVRGEIPMTELFSRTVCLNGGILFLSFKKYVNKPLVQDLNSLLENFSSSNKFRGCPHFLANWFEVPSFSTQAIALPSQGMCIDV